MHVLEIRREIPDLDEWKARFDGDPLGRERSGMRGYRIASAVDDAREVTIQLDFDAREAAEAFRLRLEEQWRAQPYGSGTVRLLLAVAREEFAAAG